MKSWFNSSELAGLPGLPTSSRAVLIKAKREHWKSRKHSGRGGGRDFHYSALPEETRACLAARVIELKTAPASTRKPANPVNKIDIAHAVRELILLHEKQERLLAEGKRLVVSILSALDPEA